jgi:endonuclease/exonuclease/phosphatase family metal-dependent hydrolase
LISAEQSSGVARKESIKLIINKIEEVNSEQLPVFLTADFNSDTDESCFNPLHQVMKDARATAPVTDQEATYNGYKTSGTRKLDHIFYDNGCVASIFQTLKENYGAPYISDHYPVRTCFVLF